MKVVVNIRKVIETDENDIRVLLDELENACQNIFLETFG